MATTIEECEELCKAVDETGLKYMMAETVVYSREFLFIKELYDKGELGKLQYRRKPPAGHGWLAKLLGGNDPDALRHARRQPLPWNGRWIGRVRQLFRQRHSGMTSYKRVATSLPSRVATSKFRTATSPRTYGRFLYDVARQYRESIDVYGSKKSFEWTLVEGAEHLARGQAARGGDPREGGYPDSAHLLPEPIQKFTQSIEDADHLSFVQGGGHGGSHPHMVNEFLSALVEDRDPWPNAKTSANWTCVGICAHQSAEQGGARVDLPAFTL